MTKPVQKVTTATSFINGVLVPPGTPVTIDTDQVDLEAKDATGKKTGETPGLTDMGDYKPAPPIVMAAIGPTGPNPTAPQQLAPGMFQTLDGYAAPDGTRVIAEGSAEALQVEEGGPSTGAATKTEEPDALDQSVEKLTAHLETISDLAEIDRLIAAEKAGKSRAGATAALEARKAELAPLA